MYKGATSNKKREQRVDYFADEKLRDRKGKISLQEIKGTVARAQESSAPGAGEYDIEIITGERTWVVRADGTAQQQKWIRVFNGAASKACCGRNDSPPVAVAEDGKVPEVFLQMTTALERLSALSTEGIFRVPGDKTVVDGVLRALAEARKAGAGPEITREVIAGCTCVHAAASLLRMWMRTQPPIIPRTAFPVFEAIVAEQQKGDER